MQKNLVWESVEYDNFVITIIPQARPNKNGCIVLARVYIKYLDITAECFHLTKQYYSKISFDDIDENVSDCTNADSTECDIDTICYMSILDAKTFINSISVWTPNNYVDFLKNYCMSNIILNTKLAKIGLAIYENKYEK
jgi:hypothetical protein